MAAMADDNPDSDISEADLNQVAKSIADLDDMDADLFGGPSKKSSVKGRSGKPTTPRRSSLTPRSRSGTPRSGKTGSPRRPPTPGSPTRSGDSSPRRTAPKSPSPPTPQVEYKPGTAPGKMTDMGRESENLKPGQSNKIGERPQTVPKAKPKIDFGEFDEDDPLAGLLSDDESEIQVKKPSLKPPLKHQTSSDDVIATQDTALPGNTDNKPADNKPTAGADATPSLFDRPPTRSGTDTADTERSTDVKPKPVVKKREERLFSDDEDMLDGLGIDDKPKTPIQAVSKDREEDVRPARNVLDSLLGKDSVNKHLQKTERKEFILDKKFAEKDQAGDDEDDFIFGDYKPSSVVGSRPTSRRSVRFQDDDIFGTDDKPPSRGRSDSGRPKTPDDMDWLELASGNRTSIDTPKVPEKKELKFTPKSAPSDWLGLKDSPNDDEDDDIFKSSTPNQSKGRTDNISKTLNRDIGNDDWLERLKAMNDDGSDGIETDTKKEEITPARKVETTPARKVETTPASAADDYLGLGEEIDLDDILRTKPESPILPGRQSTTNNNGSVNGSYQRRRILLDDDDDIFPARETNVTNHNQDISTSITSPRVPLSSKLADLQELDESPYFKKKPQSQASRQQQPIIQTSVFPSRDPEVQSLRNVNTLPSASISGPAVSHHNMSANPSAGYQHNTPQYYTPQVMPQSSSFSSPQNIILPNSIPEAHAMLQKLQIEKQYTESLLDGTKRRYEEEIIAVETSFRNRMRILEESNSKKESRLREENEQLMQQHLTRVRQMEEEKAELANQNYSKLEELERQRAKDVETIKEQHRISFSILKREHEEAIERLKEAKNLEINAVANANDTSRSLTAVVEQIQTSAKDIGSLQSQVESIHRSGLDEREISLKAKDEQLKSLQERLSRQEEDNERERKRLEDLIARMETQMREQTRLLDEERWKMKGDMSRLEANQRSLEEEKRMWLEQQSRERAALERARENFQEENRTALSQLNNERRNLAEERMKWTVDLKLSREQSHQEAIKMAQTEAEYEVLTKSIAEEKTRSSARKQELQMEEDRIANERGCLEREKFSIEKEKERLSNMALQMKSKSAEIDSMTEMANRTQSEGDRSLMEAKNVESQQNQRLAKIQQELQQLKSMEDNMAQEKLKISKEREELQNLRNSALCVNCRSPLNGAAPPNGIPMINSSQVMMSSPIPGVHAGRYSSVMSNGLGRGQLSMNAIETITSSIAADRSIRMWKIQALKDKDYLEEESMFLETLKHSPYHGGEKSFH
ncbi:fas-binding factor 1 homolog [Patella vulgata]|uniref:fas-binding factor 1 homolog n=1 Tax=Patella vulgata TaxID=6465 RepID=UPI00217F3828|nr:fas-binding factor 1 homolog [Patella vulgata]